LADRRDDSKISVSANIANAGDAVQFDCDSMSSNMSGAHPTTWTFNNSRFFGALYYKGYDSIVLDAVKFKDAGSYSCYGVAQDEKNQLMYFAATISLTIYSMLVAIICL